jgi:hypothetical protein
MNFGLIADVTGCRIVRLCFVLTFVVYNTDIFHDTANNTCDNFKASIVYFELSHKFSDIFFAAHPQPPWQKRDRGENDDVLIPSWFVVAKCV